MTTIAATKNAIACDLQATHSSGYKFKVKTKLFEFNNPVFYPKKFVMGYCGDLDTVPDILDYLGDLTGTMKCPRVKQECLILTEDHKIYTFVNPSKWILVDEDCYAIGSGMQYALGAMKTGSSPKEAVLAASKLDPMTGLGVKIVEYK